MWDWIYLEKKSIKSTSREARVCVCRETIEASTWVRAGYLVPVCD